MDVSIIIPVFNKSEFTRVCLNALRRELPPSVKTEVIVIDNNSTDETAAVLAEHSWVVPVRNDTNRGFAGGNNQGAKIARGRFLLLLNNDTEVRTGFLEGLLRAAEEPGAGVVGGRLLFANETVQHAGVVIQPNRFGPHPFVPYHYLWSSPGRAPAVMKRNDFQVVTGACLLTPRALYEELGGLDEVFWNGYEDVDYCFKVLRRGLRVIYEPSAEALHFESQSGMERFARIAYNADILDERWRGFPKFDHNRHYLRAGNIRRWTRFPNKLSCLTYPAPKTTVLVHGKNCADPASLSRAIRATNAPIERIVWCVDAPVPNFNGVTVSVRAGDAVAAARAEMQVRGDRYLMFLDAESILIDGWLDELIESLEWGTDVVAATGAPELAPGRDVTTLTSDARCTLLSLRQLPQDLELGPFETLGGALADFLLRTLPYEFATRVVQAPVGQFGAPPHDSVFASRRGAPIGSFLRDDPAYVEDALKGLLDRPQTPAMASIIMLSWNAPAYTQIALNSIREHTKMPHEIIIVDNGSGDETTAFLRAQSDIKVIYNRSNRGFAHGCNQGIAAASGDYIVLLNNDVVVTDGWLENLVGALRRDPATGVSAPRSNEIAGTQRLTEASYADLDEMHRMANARARDFARSGYFTDRAIGFCLCIERRVIEQVGGIDETFLTGNFEDDDFCMRVRAAGYRIFVCDDVFIHHFGSVSFKSNNVDYMETMHRNWARFAAKWGYPREYPTHGYDPGIAIRGGFDRAKHYVSLPVVASVAPAEEPSQIMPPKRLLLMSVVQDEKDWSSIGAVARRYLSAFEADDDVAFAIACVGELGADQIASRVENMLGKFGIDAARCADVIVSDEDDLARWHNGLNAVRRFEVPGARGPRLEDVPPLESRGKSDLKRLYASAVPS